MKPRGAGDWIFVLPIVLGLIVVLLVLAVPARGATTARVRHGSFTEAAANIRSYPVMSRSAYRHDIARLTRIRGHKWVAGAEIQRRHDERRLWVRLWHRVGYRTPHPRVEVTQAVWHRFRILSSRVRFLHRRAPGPVSPPRRAVITRMRMHGFRVAGISLHLTNGCFPGKRDRWWYASRCRALRVEIRRVRRWVGHLRSRGYSVAVAGDMNRHRTIDWARHAPQRARVAGLMQIAVVPARGVRVGFSNYRVIRRLHTDHDVPVVAVHLSR